MTRWTLFTLSCRWHLISTGHRLRAAGRQYLADTRPIQLDEEDEARAL